MLILAFHFLLYLLFVCVAGESGDGHSDYALKESHPLPGEWFCVERAASHHELELHIGLRQSRFDKLEQALHESGKYLSVEEVQEHVRPSKNAVTQVQNWLQEHGITKEQLVWGAARDWISVRLPVDVVEGLLRAEYFLFQHESSGVTALRALNWSLPRHLHGHIDTIQPTTSFLEVFMAGDALRSRASLSKRDEDPLSKPTDLIQLGVEVSDSSKLSPRLGSQASTLTVEQVCNASAVTPLCLSVLYGFKNYRLQAPEKNSMAVINFAPEFSNQSDTTLYLSNFRPDILSPNITCTFTDFSIKGGTNPQTPATPEQIMSGIGREGNLDVQLLQGIACPTPLRIYTVGDTVFPPFIPDAANPINNNAPLLTLLNDLLSQPSPPHVLSISYADHEQTVPEAYARRICSAFAQLGARGTTVVFGSGDQGLGRPGTCISNTRPKIPTFIAKFPESCPFGVSVGATAGVAPERVAHNPANGFVSGAGFSRYFARPWFQAAVVPAYFQRVNSTFPSGGGTSRDPDLFNAAGRAYPDVAAQGTRVSTVWNGRTYLVDGTSASAPTFAGIVVLVNDALLARGRPPMGFLNPWLYSVGGPGGAFRDIREGVSTGCQEKGTGADGGGEGDERSGSVVAEEGKIGFPAAEGWDVASGWGTPWFPRFLELALEAPAIKFDNGDSEGLIGQDVPSKVKPWYYLDGGSA
ncbi:hypothetical protein MMC30_009031 [Trapelia coarctata]|nr:hypothetical protein [Trapelia coarctata]